MKLKQFLACFGIIGVAMFVSMPVLAASLVGPTKEDPNVLIGAQSSYKNLYTAGSNVTVNGNVSGDLMAAGGMITITGKIEKDAGLVGGTIIINSPVAEDLRLLGGNITVTAPVGGDLVIVGGNVNLTSLAEVGGDLLVAGGNVIVDSPVKGSIKIAGGTVTINNKVGGDINIITNKTLTFGSAAEVAGKIWHKGVSPAVVSGSAKISPIEYTHIEAKNYKKQAAGLLSLSFLIKLLAWFVATLLLIKLFKKHIQKMSDEFKAKPWENLGYGLLSAIAVPVLVVLLFVTFVGYYIAALTLTAYVFAMMLTSLLGSLILGHYLLSKMTKPGELLSDWQAALLGVVVWLIVGKIPVLGWLAIAVLFLMTLGVLVKALKGGYKENLQNN